LKQSFYLFFLCSSKERTKERAPKNDNRGLSLLLLSLYAITPLQAPVRTVFGFALTPMMFLE